jgi:hypothetical protein
MNLLFVFVLASGAVFYQPQSQQNCLKLETAFSNGDKITASVDNEDVPIVRGACIAVEDDASELPPTIIVEAANIFPKSMAELLP